MTKESLREKFYEKWNECNCNGGFDYGQCSKHLDNEELGGQSNAKEKIFDFFWNETQKREEEVINILYNNFYYCDCTRDSDGNLGCTCGGNLSERDRNILTLIKSNE